MRRHQGITVTRWHGLGFAPKSHPRIVDADAPPLGLPGLCNVVVSRRVSESLCTTQKEISPLRTRNGMGPMHGAREAKVVAYDGIPFLRFMESCLGFCGPPYTSIHRWWVTAVDRIRGTLHRVSRCSSAVNWSIEHM